MASSRKTKAKEVVDSAVEPEDSGDYSDPDSHDVVGPDAPEDNQPSTSQKKKKKKSKAVKALNALRGRSEIPQEVVNRVMDKVKEGHGEGTLDGNEENVRAALEHLKIMDVVKGKAGVGGKNKKDMGQHKVHPLNLIFWKMSYVVDPVLGNATRSTAGSRITALLTMP